MSLQASTSSTSAGVTGLVSSLHELKELMELSKAAMDKAQRAVDRKRKPHPPAEHLKKLPYVLKSSYIAACKESHAAAACSQKVLEILLVKLSARSSPRTGFIQPVKLNPRDDIWSPRPGVVLPIKSEVAALVDEHSDPKMWILASIKRFDDVRNRYTVIDQDPSSSKTYIVDLDKVIALPTFEEFPLNKRAEFCKNEDVLAIYPQTTVFYPARIVEGPRKLKSASYSLVFQEDGGKSRKIAAQHVVPLPTRFYS